MEFLNNLNVILGTIVSAIAILTTIISCIKFLLKKASTSQPKIAQQRMPRKRSSYQTIVKPLNKLDWMEVLWTGFEDCLRAREGQGWIVSVIFTFTLSAEELKRRSAIFTEDFDNIASFPLLHFPTDLLS